MSSRIRYAWGHSSAGDFFVAKNGEDLVRFEFPLRADDAVAALRRRFAGSAIEEDAIGLKPTIVAFTRFIEFAGCFPFG